VERKGKRCLPEKAKGGHGTGHKRKQKNILRLVNEGMKKGRALRGQKRKEGSSPSEQQTKERNTQSKDRVESMKMGETTQGRTKGLNFRKRIGSTFEANHGGRRRRGEK